MKISEAWLREWANPILTRDELSKTLTMGGFEVEELSPVAETFAGVVIGEVVSIERHNKKDQLQVCKVNINKPHLLTIVCGAPNVRTGMKVPVAMINSLLPNKITITATLLHGIESEGMLCSASELGLAEESQGLLELPQDAPLGEDLWSYLELEDYTLDVSITPNRGDCLSVRGLSREVAALTRTPLLDLSISQVKSVIKDTIPVKVIAKKGCPRYVGRVIRGVKVDVQTPAWMRERLRRSGVRSINPIVDVTNYVMLELGQPMHAFDLNKIKKEITVRESKQGEQIILLDGSDKTLDDKTLVIADHENPLAIAGVMGGLDSSVTSLTNDIFLESAYFSPQTIARQRQFYNLSSESAYRFERSIDPTIQVEAIERATQLILEIAGGKPGPVIEEVSTNDLPRLAPIKLIKNKVTDVLGVDVPNKEIENIFALLKFKPKKASAKEAAWDVQVPPYRLDMSLPEDLIEEIARLYGYDKIPTHFIKAQLKIAQHIENGSDLSFLRQSLSDQGFHEIISYSFIDKKLQELLDPKVTARELMNPITADMTVMRTNLWPGLVNALLYNKSRQQARVRLFEIGTCFVTHGTELLQQPRLGGLISGFALPEQWGVPVREADFYDLKGSIENLLALLGEPSDFSFKQDTHPALHPGQTASIYHKDQKIGLLGALHPTVLQALDLTDKVFVFELDLNLLKKAEVRHFREISKFPEIRRDIALIVNQAIPVKDIQDTIKLIAGDWLKYIFIFDVYQGKGITPGLKSVALALILQHPTRTLVDDEVAELMERVIATLRQQLGAELRS